MKRLFLRFSAMIMAMLMIVASVPSIIATTLMSDMSGLRFPFASLSAYPLDMPSNLTTSLTADGIRISWQKVSGADKYRVYYINADGVWEGLGNTTSTSFVHSKLTSGKTYTYTVRCLDTDGTAVSDYDKFGVTCEFIKAPGIVSLINTNQGVSVKWESVPGASSYRIYKSTVGGSFATLDIVSGTSYVDSGVSSGTKYTYTVQALDKNLNSITHYNSGDSITYCSAPIITKTEVTASGIKVTWNKVSGADAYRLYYINSDGVWQGIGNTESNSYTHTGLVYGKSYTYTVRCLNSSRSAISDYDRVGLTATFFSTPEVNSVVNTDEGVVINWKTVEGIERYRVYKRTDGSDWKRVTEVIGATYTDSDVTSGKTYTYTVRGIDNNDIFISYYTPGKKTTYFRSPEITGVENTATGSVVKWNAVNGAVKYRVYFVNDEGVWQGIGNTTSTSFVHDNLVSGTKYTYTVRCLDSNDNPVSDYDEIGTSNIFYAPPVIKSVFKASNGALLMWDKPEGVYAYRIFKKTVGTSWERIVTTKGNYHLDKDVSDDSVCTYTIRYVDENDNYISEYIDDTKYYSNGVLANGNYVISGENCYFVDGMFRSGYQTIGGKKYYYGADGTIQKNGIVGSDKDGWSYADKNGVICESEDIVYAVKFVKQYGKGSTKAEQLRSCFNTLVSFRYERVLGLPKNGEDFRKMAIKMFRDKSGNCFCYGAAFACVAKVLGFDARVVNGQIASAYGGVTPHGWAQVKRDGAWLICDPDMQKESSYFNYYMCTFASYPVKPLITENTYNIEISDGVSVWK